MLYAGCGYSCPTLLGASDSRDKEPDWLYATSPLMQKINPALRRYYKEKGRAYQNNWLKFCKKQKYTESNFINDLIAYYLNDHRFAKQLKDRYEKEGDTAQEILLVLSQLAKPEERNKHALQHGKPPTFFEPLDVSFPFEDKEKLSEAEKLKIMVEVIREIAYVKNGIAFLHLSKNGEKRLIEGFYKEAYDDLCKDRTTEQLKKSLPKELPTELIVLIHSFQRREEMDGKRFLELYKENQGNIESVLRFYEPKQNLYRVLPWVFYDEPNLPSIMPQVSSRATMAKARRDMYPNEYTNDVEYLVKQGADVDSLVTNVLHQDSELAWEYQLRLSWLILGTEQSKQGALVPPKEVNVSSEAVLKLIEKDVLVDTVNQILLAQPHLCMKVLREAIKRNFKHWPKETGEVFQKILKDWNNAEDITNLVTKILNDLFYFSNSRNDLLRWLMTNREMRAKITIIPPKQSFKEVAQTMLKKHSTLNEQQINFLDWLIIKSSQGWQKAILPPAQVKITLNTVKGILAVRTSDQLYRIITTILSEQKEARKRMLQEQLRDGWASLSSLDYALLYLLTDMGPPLDFSAQQIEHLQASTIVEHLIRNTQHYETEEVLHKILTDKNNAATLERLKCYLFPSNTAHDNSILDSLKRYLFSSKPFSGNNTFSWQEVNWQKVRWNDIEEITDPSRRLVTSDIPVNTVFSVLGSKLPKKTKSQYANLFRQYTSKVKKVFEIHFSNIAVSRDYFDLSYSVAWPLEHKPSKEEWKNLALLTEYGMITAEEVIEAVAPNIESSDPWFKKNYNLSDIQWHQFDWEALPGLVTSGIALFSKRNYEKMGLYFFPHTQYLGDREWREIDFDIANFLFDKGALSKQKILALNSVTLQGYLKDAPSQSAEAKFWRKVQQAQKKERRDIEIRAIMAILLCFMPHFIYLMYFIISCLRYEEQDLKQGEQTKREKKGLGEEKQKSTPKHSSWLSYLTRP